MYFPDNHSQHTCFKKQDLMSLYQFYSFLQISKDIIILPLTRTPISLSHVQTFGWKFWYLFLLHLIHHQQKFQGKGWRLNSFMKPLNFWYCFCRSLWIKIRKGIWQFHAICISSQTQIGHFFIQICVLKKLESILQSR